jgi:hypothetical protein
VIERRVKKKHEDVNNQTRIYNSCSPLSQRPDSTQQTADSRQQTADSIQQTADKPEFPVETDGVPSLYKRPDKLTLLVVIIGPTVV